MLIDALNKIMFLLFFMSLLNTIRHTYYFIQTMVSATEENPTKYKLDKRSLFLLCASIAYLLTSIFDGIKL